VIGGQGNDVLVGQGFAFTAGQRAAIFAQTSIETIQDTSGTYVSPPHFTFSPIAGDNVINAAEAQSPGGITISGLVFNVADGQHVTMGLNGLSYDAIVASHAWSVVVPQADIAALVEGNSYLITAQALNDAGTGLASHSVSVDTTAPVAPSLVLANDTGTSPSDKVTSNPSITYTASAASDILLYKADGAATFSSTAPVFATNGTADGLHTVSVEEQDAAGNISAAASLTFTLDTTTPAAPSVALHTDSGSLSTDQITNSGVVDVSGLEAGASWQYSTDNGAHWLDGNGTSLALTGDGPKSVMVHQTDAAGNTSSDSAAFSFTLDATAAAVTEKLANDTGLSSAGRITNDATITGSGDVNAVVHFVVDGNAVAETTTANASGSWTYNPAGLLGGYHTIVASETDAAGNTGAATLTFDVDTTAVAGLSFTNTSFAAGVTPYGAATGDLNHDGKPDIVVTNYNAGEVSVLLGNGNGSFQAPVAYATGGNGVVAVQIADLNGDGIPDLVSTEEANDTVSVLMGNGDGTFQNETTYTSGVRPHGVAIADVNGDGQPDLVVADFGSNAVSVFLGNGNGKFASPTSYAVGTEPYGVKIGDLNGDGKPDVVVSNPTGSTFSVLLSNGDGTFQPQSSYHTGATSWEGALADLNGDGKLDYVVPSMANATVSVFLGNGDGSFQSATNYPVNNSPTAVVIGDLNGDGLPDLAVTSGVGTLSILLGNGNGTFPECSVISGGSLPNVGRRR
jgi:FG-GAP-like repeat/Bacterial Ig-like domain